MTPTLESLTKSLDRMTEEELQAEIHNLREGRKIKKRIKKEHTMKGKRETNRGIKTKFSKMSAEEKAAFLEVLKNS